MFYFLNKYELFMRVEHTIFAFIVAILVILEKISFDFKLKIFKYNILLYFMIILFIIIQIIKCRVRNTG